MARQSKFPTDKIEILCPAKNKQYKHACFNYIYHQVFYYLGAAQIYFVYFLKNHGCPPPKKPEFSYLRKKEENWDSYCTESCNHVAWGKN